MSSVTIHQRLLDIRGDFLRALSTKDNRVAAVAAFSSKWTQLDADLRAASSAGLLEDDTVVLAHATAAEVAILSNSLTRESVSTVNITTGLTDDLESLFSELTLSRGDTTNLTPSSPRSRSPSSPDPSLPPYIEPAYKWLLKHLHNPYPKKAIKEKIADETGSSFERISDWFVDVRRRMGWSRILREDFGRKRADLIAAATRHFIGTDDKSSLPADIHGKLVQMEAFAQDMYAAKLVPSALSNKLSAAVKDLTPERREKARLDRLHKLETRRAAANYPSPAPSDAPSPVSDSGASTSSAGRKRSYSESSDDYDDSLSKRSRYVYPRVSVFVSLTAFAGLMALSLSPPLPVPITLPPLPASADFPMRALLALNALAPSGAASDSVVTLSGNPDHLADWFSSDLQNNKSIFDDQLLDFNSFDSSEFDFAEESLLAQPVVQATAATLPSTPELDTVSIDVPATAELEYWLNLSNFSDDYSQQISQPSSDFADLEQAVVSYVPMLDPYSTPLVYEPPPFTEPLTGGYDQGFITQQSVAESFGLDSSLLSFGQPQVYSALPSEKTSAHLTAGLLEQLPRKNQNDYTLYQPIVC
ncbi:Homeodomain 1 [Mycena sanguinolenta]|uniref:Homeodomain 1 n=1 Tax=Mycena sanguinolenta TaxID=230812 RepID=A0A8H7CIV3_9AGAR|nr:Homeodomain 1 [Mycena sanguinolenta]